MIDYRWSITHGWLLMIDNRWSITEHWLPMIDYRWSITDDRLPMVDYRWSITDGRLSMITDDRLPIHPATGGGEVVKNYVVAWSSCYVYFKTVYKQSNSRNFQLCVLAALLPLEQSSYILTFVATSTAGAPPPWLSMVPCVYTYIVLASAVKAAGRTFSSPSPVFKKYHVLHNSCFIRSAGQKILDPREFLSWMWSGNFLILSSI